MLGSNGLVLINSNSVSNENKEYSGTSLKLYKSIENNELNYLIGFKNKIIKDEISLTNKIDNSVINRIFY